MELNTRDDETAFMKQANDFHICLSIFDIKLGDPKSMHVENVFDGEFDVLDFHLDAIQDPKRSCKRQHEVRQHAGEPLLISQWPDVTKNTRITAQPRYQIVKSQSVGWTAVVKKAGIGDLTTSKISCI